MPSHDYFVNLGRQSGEARRRKEAAKHRAGHDMACPGCLTRWSRDELRLLGEARRISEARWARYRVAVKTAQHRERRHAKRRGGRPFREVNKPRPMRVDERSYDLEALTDLL